MSEVGARPRPAWVFTMAGSTLLWVAGCGSDSAASEGGPAANGGACGAASSLFASSVTSFEFGSGQDFGQDAFPAAVLGPPSGAGCCAGSLEVTSLGDGGFVTLAFEDNFIVDGPGVDFIVFENAFRPPGAGEDDVFAELGEVSVSQDGGTWFTYPCTATSYPYGSCAGWHPVLLNADAGPVAALDPGSTGGDPFDLAELGVDWARYVRIVDRRATQAGPGTFDLDAVGIVQPACAGPAESFR